MAGTHVNMQRAASVLVATLIVLFFSSGAEARKYRHNGYYSSGTVVPHPAGCPRRLFCGCGASVKVFGRPVRDLYLAVEWIRKFPRTSPAPGMAAARRGHVFVLLHQVKDSIWMVYDANSGGGLTRVHERDISPYVIVNPHA